MAEDEIDDLIRQLGSSSSIKQEGAASELGEIAEKNPNSPELVRAVNYLVDSLTVNHLKNGAVCGLKKIGKPAVPTLIDALKNRDSNTRWYLAWLLGEINDARVIPALVETLNDMDSDVRRKAWGSLVKIGKAAIPCLINVLKSENAAGRWKAAEALGDIKDSRAVPALVDTLKDENAIVRKRAARALEKIGFEKIGLNEKVFCLLLLAKNKEIVAIGKSAVAAVVDALENENTDVRKNAAGALVEIIQSLTDYIHLRETEVLLRHALEKGEGKKKLVNSLETINRRRNEILEPEAKKLKPPKILKRKKKPKERWRVIS